MTTTKFEVGDKIWWLDTRFNCKPTIKLNTILDIKIEACGAYGYIINDNYNTCVWSPTIVVARTKEELIELLYPTKCGEYEYNQLVYTVETNGNAIGLNVTNSLVIDKAYVKHFDCNRKHYKVSDKQDDSGTVITYPAASIYKSAEMVKQAVVEWLNNNDT
jgi:hypothetical protein